MTKVCLGGDQPKAEKSKEEPLLSRDAGVLNLEPPPRGKPRFDEFDQPGDQSTHFIGNR